MGGGGVRISAGDPISLEELEVASLGFLESQID